MSVAFHPQVDVCDQGAGLVNFDPQQVLLQEVLAVCVPEGGVGGLHFLGGEGALAVWGEDVESAFGVDKGVKDEDVGSVEREELFEVSHEEFGDFVA